MVVKNTVRMEFYFGTNYGVPIETVEQMLQAADAFTLAYREINGALFLKLCVLVFKYYKHQNTGTQVDSKTLHCYI